MAWPVFVCITQTHNSSLDTKNEINTRKCIYRSPTLTALDLKTKKLLTQFNNNFISFEIPSWIVYSMLNLCHQENLLEYLGLLDVGCPSTTMILPILSQMAAITAWFLVSPWISWTLLATELQLHHLPRGDHSWGSLTSC